MPDLLTHVLTVYILGTIGTWKTEQLSPRMVPIGMAGAGIPDVAKLHLLIEAETIEAITGISFTWAAFHRLGPVVMIAGITAMFFGKRVRKRVFAWLLFGAGTHLILDLGVKRASDAAPPYLYPISWWHPPSANLYLSSEIWPTILAVSLAAMVWYFDRHRG